MYLENFYISDNSHKMKNQGKESFYERKALEHLP